MTFLAIDPGIHTGWCVLNSVGTIHVVGKGETFPILSNRAAIIEQPQVYRASKSKGDPNNLITLAIRVGRYEERLSAAGVQCQLVLPTTWKGQINKHSHHLRTAASLTRDELQIVTAVAKSPEVRGYSEDVWDAVALAKWAFLAGRFAVSQNAS